MQSVPPGSSSSTNNKQALSTIQLPQVPQPFLVDTTEKKKKFFDHFQVFIQVLAALAVPLTLLWGIYQFKAQQYDDRVKTEKQAALDTARALDQQQQTTLDTYLDRMSDLLFVQHLNTAKKGDQVVNIAIARTDAALQNLNPARKIILLQFLYKTDLLNWHNFSTTQDARPYPYIKLDYADLKGIDLRGIFMDNVDMHDTFLNKAQMSGSVLAYNNFSISIMQQADLSRSSLHGTDLHGADLTGATLTDTLLNCNSVAVSAHVFDFKVLLPCPNLQGVNFSGATMKHTHLQGTDLSSANFTNANLSGALLNCSNPQNGSSCVKLRGAILNGADFSGANLQGADVDVPLLEKVARSLHGTIMPDGSTHP